MAESEEGPGVPGPRKERRVTGEQRRYNRRSPVSDVAPPYYEVFERIAVALERIEGLMARRVIDLGAAEEGSTKEQVRSSGRPADPR